IGNNNEVMVCFPNPDAAPGATLLHSEYIYGDDYYAVTTAFPCFSKDGRRIMMPSADADVFGGATPGKAFVTVIDLEYPFRRGRLLLCDGKYPRQVGRRFRKEVFAGLRRGEVDLDCSQLLP
ncbi:MAG: hypothetical protein MJY56_07595, partial [Bacteroidales bacterium]|nr:hypothetical protein [Bacteroidales bacterium]